jgi:hypothetical protein
MFRVGAALNGSEPYVGDIAELRVYNTQLTLSEIQAIEAELDQAYNFIPDLPGDFNSDTVVDMVDFGILRDHMLGHFEGPVSYEDGDIDLNAKVDLYDFKQFQALFPGVAGAATVVPEPSTLALALGALAGIVAGLRRRPARDIEN